MLSPKVHDAAPLLLRLLSLRGSTITSASLRCLGRIAGCADRERRGILKAALDDDDDGQGGGAVGALVAELRARPIKHRAATDAALLLWVASSGDDTVKKERLLLRHGALAAIAEILTVVLADANAGGTLLVRQHDSDDVRERGGGGAHNVAEAEVFSKIANADEMLIIPTSPVVAAVDEGRSIGVEQQDVLTSKGGESLLSDDGDNARLLRTGGSDDENVDLKCSVSVAEERTRDGEHVMESGSVEQDATVVKEQRVQAYGRETVDKLLENCFGLCGSLLAQLGPSCSKRDAAAKAISAQGAGSLAAAAAACIKAERGESGSVVKERALALLSNMSLHERFADAAAGAPAIAMLVLRSELSSVQRLPADGDFLQRSRAAAPMVKQAAALLVNGLRLSTGTTEAAVDPYEALELVSQALKVLHASLPAPAPAAQASFASAPPAALPSPAQLSGLQTLLGAVAACSDACEANGGGGGGSSGPIEAAATAAATLLNLSQRAASATPELAPELSATADAAVAALYSLLSRGHVHPEARGLAPLVLQHMPALLAGVAADRLSVPPPLLLLDEICRSKRLAALVAAALNIVAGLLHLAAAPRDALDGGLMRLLQKLRRYDRYRYLEFSGSKEEKDEVGTMARPGKAESKAQEEEDVEASLG